MSAIDEVSNLPAVLRPIERSAVILVPVMDLNTAKNRLREFQEFVDGYLSESGDGGQDGGDYGIIPGTKKKTLLKSGADKLCELYGLYDEYATISSVEDWDKGLFDYTLKCILKSRRDDSMVGTGVGSCSTYESKYRWRESQRKCPHCDQAAIIKGKDFKNDGLPTGWLCFAKKGGCGAKFKDGDKSIEGQVLGRVENPDIIDMKNTVLKIAKKRAKIDAVIGVTRSSGIFAQDLDEVILPNQPPPKKPVEVIEKDIEISGPANSGGADTLATPLVKEPVSAQAADIYIDNGQAVNFHRMFKDSLKPKLRAQADTLCHDWLRSQDILDDKGQPTAARIRKDSFYEVREQAVLFAQSL